DRRKQFCRTATPDSGGDHATGRGPARPPVRLSRGRGGLCEPPERGPHQAKRAGVSRSLGQLLSVVRSCVDRKGRKAESPSLDATSALAVRAKGHACHTGAPRRSSARVAAGRAGQGGGRQPGTCPQRGEAAGGAVLGGAGVAGAGSEYVM